MTNEKYDNGQQKINKMQLWLTMIVGRGESSYQNNALYKEIGQHDEVVLENKRVWIGDGTSIRPKIAVNINDHDEIERIQDITVAMGLKRPKLTHAGGLPDNKGGHLYMAGKAGQLNCFWHLIRLLSMGTQGSKTLPMWFSSEKIIIRENLLAVYGRTGGGNSVDLHEDEGDLESIRTADIKAAWSLYQDVDVTTICSGIADGMVALARSLGIGFSMGYREEFLQDGGNWKRQHTVRMKPCGALTTVLSLKDAVKMIKTTKSRIVQPQVSNNSTLALNWKMAQIICSCLQIMLMYMFKTGVFIVS
ncbi:hypothetical protein BCR42DRAFT_487577 [Absidia repens]|uniref:Homing endonuclease PI-Sce domain-containing protein n=1 Tax=Absidia repens TaxID=90262 RepID=A0A1X2IX59_9FUNG|nr:hypothetical protein BCR42DRAFT_487577 [Absidia repens]